MYQVAVRDHIMIAHSLPRPVFGPAQQLHGATYGVTAIFTAPHLDEDGIVIDIGLATDRLAECLAPLRYRNLDELADFKGSISTTEVIATRIHGRLVEALDGKFSGELEIRLDENPMAWASYTGPCP